MMVAIMHADVLKRVALVRFDVCPKYSGDVHVYVGLLLFKVLSRRKVKDR